MNEKKFCIQTTFFRFKTTYINKKFIKKKFGFLKIFRCKTILIENEINQNTQNEKVGSEFDESNEINENENTENKEYKNSVPSTSKENLKVVRRSEKKKSHINRYRNPITNCIYVIYVSVDNPENYIDAITSNESENWPEAMNREIECLNKNETQILVEKLKDKKILDLTLVYTKKADDRFKARIVVRGFQQKEIIEYIYSPVTRTQTLKIFIKLLCARRFNDRSNGCRVNIPKWKNKVRSICEVTLRLR